MPDQRSNAVARVAGWCHAGVTYQVLVGQAARFAGYLAILAFGPESSYRAVVFEPSGAHSALSSLLATPDPGSRSSTAECLLAIRTMLVN